MRRAISTKNMFDKKDKVYEFDGLMLEIFGKASRNGLWLIQGEEKNGKTWGALLIAKALSRFAKVHYISAEEGLELEFRAAVKRAGIVPEDNIQWTEYEEITDLNKRLRKQRAPKIVVLDNLTHYNDELKGSGIKKLLADHPNTHFIALCHLENGVPYGSAAKMARKYCKRIITAKGLALIVAGRQKPKTILIDEVKAKLYHGDSIKQ